MPPHFPFPAVMGILNVTPDSFYDGGQYSAVEEGVSRAIQMLAEGADIIDVGGESTGPESREVSAEDERKRVLPVIAGILQKKPAACISIDTYKADVVHAALQAGVRMVNDVTAGRGDPAMFSVIAKTDCLYVMMRSKDPTPRTTKDPAQYDDVIASIHAFFEERIFEAKKAGVKHEQIILDPGLGHFVSGGPKYSWEILERLEELKDFSCPILVSPSRKSFTAGPENLPASERLPETLRATKIALENGASIIRTHDVKQTKEIVMR